MGFKQQKLNYFKIQILRVLFNYKCQKKHEKEPKKHEKNKKDNVIDFLSYLKKKRDEEQCEEEIKDPF